MSRKGEVACLAVVAGHDLQRRFPGSMSDATENLGNLELTRVAQAGWVAALGTENDIDADRGPDRAERVDLHPRISPLYSSQGVG